MSLLSQHFKLSVMPQLFPFLKPHVVRSSCVTSLAPFGSFLTSVPGMESPPCPLFLLWLWRFLPSGWTWVGMFIPE